MPCNRFGGIYIMTMHPFVTGRPSRIILLERLIDYMRSFEIAKKTLGL
jgi:peptidoglycan-N-acetylglucosamine deacetylase